jgi:uridine kinase
LSLSIRDAVLKSLANLIESFPTTHPLRVAIDGRTASGKTTLADELAERLVAKGREIIRTSIDGFHRPKVERYARGRHSAEGYYYDARDLDAINSLLLSPLGADGSREYRTASFDLVNDLPIEQATKFASSDAILIVDGTFLQRPELADSWDITVFVETTEEASEQRGVGRDMQLLGGMEAARHMYAVRYQPAYSLYESMCRPAARADAVFNNEDVAHPILVIREDGRLSSRPSAV